MGKALLSPQGAGISVAVCTFNRADSLARTLDSLVRMKPPESPWELLVIDNNSSDRTEEVVRGYSGQLPLRYVFEEKQGLSFARNRAIAECRGNLLVFTDDDVLVSEGWLRAYESAGADYPSAGYFGGRLLPHWPLGRPGWVRDESMPLIGGLVGYYDLGEAARPYAEGEMHPFGANFALRRSLFGRIAEFDPRFGVSGRDPGRGEEAEYFRRAEAAGVKGVYVGGALCLHAVQPGHLSLRFLYRFGMQKGFVHACLTGAEGGSLAGEFRFLIKGGYQLLKGHGDRFRQCIIMMGMERGLRIKGRRI